MIYNFGSINLDHFYRVPHLVQKGETLASTNYELILGGKGLNQSVAIAQAQQKVKHIGAINLQDQWLIKQLEHWQVDCQAICKLDNILSGHTMIQVDNWGENAIVLYPGANQAIDLAWLTASLADAKANDWLLLQNECHLSVEAINLSCKKHMRIALNPAPMTKLIASLPLAAIDLLILNELELVTLLQYLAPQLAYQNYRQALLELAQILPKTVLIVTLGAQGALLCQQQQFIEIKAYPVKVIDTTGAGDTFIGYYLAAITGQKDYQEALQLATAAAALCVGKTGAARSIPHFSEVQKFLQNLSA